MSRRTMFPSALRANANVDELLAREGLAERSVLSGDVNFDALLQHVELARRKSAVVDRLGLRAGGYAVLTVHRSENTDAGQLLALLDRLAAMSGPDFQVVFPIHPRTIPLLPVAPEEFSARSGIRVIKPLGFLDMLRLIDCSAMVLTDSGGLQKEAFFLDKPCITLRSETEWTETVALGGNVLTEMDPDRVEGHPGVAVGDRRRTTEPGKTRHRGLWRRSCRRLHRGTPRGFRALEAEGAIMKSAASSYLPSQYGDVFGLLARTLRSGHPAARSAVVHTALGLIAQPGDLLLRRFDRRIEARIPAPSAPIVIVCGPPRSGTTLVEQTLLRHLPVTYFSNLTNIFPDRRSPRHGSSDGRVAVHGSRPAPTTAGLGVSAGLMTRCTCGIAGSAATGRRFQRCSTPSRGPPWPRSSARGNRCFPGHW